MIIIRLRGGLGNQMFQYAMGKRMALQLGTSLKIDLTSLLKTSKRDNVTQRDYQLHIFNIEDEFLISPKLIKTFNKYGLNLLVQIIKSLKIIGCKKYKEKTFTVEQHLIDTPRNNTLYSGYWQSIAYFESANKSLIKILSFKDSLSNEATEIASKINNQSNAVCMHVRRGDYVGNGVFNVSTLDYFTKAAKQIAAKTELPHFFVFSDDPEWCATNIIFDYPFTIVNYQTNKIKYKEDLQLMAMCKHFIISASSFSWWAVWLSNQKNNFVIYPNPWFLENFRDTKDLVLKTWIPLNIS